MGKPSPTIVASSIFTVCLGILMLVIWACGGFDPKAKSHWTKAETQQIIREEMQK